MAPATNRRQFLQKTAMAAAALYSSRFAGPQGTSIPDVDPGPLDKAELRNLTSQIAGRVITADGPEYEAARLVFNRAFNQRPALIVRCAGPQDVARALEFAQRRSLPVAVRGGGHSRAGFSMCNGGMVIDLSNMKRVEVDSRMHIARAEAGALVRHLDQATQLAGLATTAGGCPNVGIAGFTLGGGEGTLMSKFGAACDNLLSAHVVTVDGRQVDASPSSNADLFWALRGGGGNFGVVTSFEYRLYPVNEILSGTITYPAHREHLHAFAKFVAEAPDELNVFAELLPSANGLRFLIHLRYIGSPQPGNDLIRPLRGPLQPLDDNVRKMTYLESQSAGFIPAPFAHFQTNLLLPLLTEPAVEALMVAINDAPAQFRVLIVPLYGAISRVNINDTAFALRQPGFEVDMLGAWNTPAERDGAVRWIANLRDKLRPMARGTYVNQLGETSAQLVRDAYGPNYPRLAEIKRKYDPANVLRLNQNITPA